MRFLNALLRTLAFIVCVLSGLPSVAKAQIEGEWRIAIEGATALENVYLKRDSGTQVPVAIVRTEGFEDRRIPNNWASLRSNILIEGINVNETSRSYRTQMGLVGGIRGLSWQGWWYLPDGVLPVRSLPLTFGNPCNGRVMITSAGTPNATTHRRLGQFVIQFNPAETEFSGHMTNDCEIPYRGRLPTASVRGWRQTKTAVTRLRPISAVSNVPRLPRVMRAFGEPRASSSLTLQLSEGGRARVVTASKDYRLTPNSVDALAGDKVQLDVLVTQDRRPMRLTFKAIAFDGPPIADSSSGETVLRIRYTGRSLVTGLPYVGLPRSGDAIFDLSFPGAFCSHFAWLPVLEFGDMGSYSDRNALRPENERESILWPVSSTCGARLHPEQVPEWAVRD